jgi:hypothetical protein
MVMKKGKTTFSIKEALEFYLSKNKHLAYKVKALDAIRLWETIVDDYIRQHTRATVVKDNVLFVNTESAVLANELSLREKELVDRMNNALRIPIIKKIAFKSGYIGKKVNKKDNINKIEKNITMKTMNCIDKAVSKVKEDELREILRSFLVTAAKRNPDF